MVVSVVVYWIDRWSCEMMMKRYVKPVVTFLLAVEDEET